MKTAILLVPAVSTPVVIDAPFGQQKMRGPFYVVAADEGSYGAAQDEFERTHRRVGENQWLKVEPVMAYRADERCAVVTMIDDHEEATVLAEAGDWIMRQQTGEVMVVKPSAFEARYVEKD